MNREIKFRAWDGKFMHYEADIVNGKHFIDGFNLESVLMQFTGLHDKNGREIYEGDIVDTHAQYDTNYIRIVIWGENCGLEFSPITGFSLCKSNEQHFEVIGNIYENTELLNP